MLMLGFMDTEIKGVRKQRINHQILYKPAQNVSDGMHSTYGTFFM